MASILQNTMQVYKDCMNQFESLLETIDTKVEASGADYTDGEKVRFLVQASKGCYIKMIYISSQNETSGEKNKINTLLFPNNHDADNWIDAGETKIIGRLGELQVQPPFGKDVITVVASEKQFSDIEGLTGGAQEAYHTEVSIKHPWRPGDQDQRDTGCTT